jgi:hypothetical protein
MSNEKVSTRPLMDKLGVKPESKVTLIGIDDETFWQQLVDRTDDAVKSRLRHDTDLIFYAADSLDQLFELGRLKTYLKPNGAIWVVSLKGKAARIKDLDVIAAARAAGLVDNKVVSFSTTHTSLRLVIPVEQRSAS